jgi:hypothetical protein
MEKSKKRVRIPTLTFNDLSKRDQNLLNPLRSDKKVSNISEYAARLNPEQKKNTLERLEGISNPKDSRKYDKDVQSLAQDIKHEILASNTFDKFRTKLEIPTNERKTQAEIGSSIINMMNSAQNDKVEWSGAIIPQNSGNNRENPLIFKAIKGDKNSSTLVDGAIQFHTHPKSYNNNYESGYKSSQKPENIYFYDFLKEIESFEDRNNKSLTKKDMQRILKVKDTLYNQSDRSPSGEDLEATKRSNKPNLIFTDNEIIALKPTSAIQTTGFDELKNPYENIDWAAKNALLKNTTNFGTKEQVIRELERKTKLFVKFHQDSQKGMAAAAGVDLERIPLNSKQQEPIKLSLYVPRGEHRLVKGVYSKPKTKAKKSTSASKGKGKKKPSSKKNNQIKYKKPSLSDKKQNHQQRQSGILSVFGKLGKSISKLFS